jgi:NAD(P)-dependent dehydrogenase (short-subunit alcohol dehydrogenase family)
VTDRDSIVSAKKVIEEKEGKLHILVNKCVPCNRSFHPINPTPSSGAVGPRTRWLNTKDAPEKKDHETFGNALFNDDGPSAWADLYTINSSSVYYTTSAFLGLLSKGSKDFEDTFTSSVVNVTSISGLVRLAQNHVCTRPIICSPPSAVLMSGDDSSATTAPRRPRRT